MTRAKSANKLLLARSLQRIKRSKYTVSIICAIIVGCAGTTMLFTARAATDTPMVEAENGVLSSNATPTVDTTASGGSAVKFGAGNNQGRALYEPSDGTAYIGVATSSNNNDLTNFDNAVGIPSHPAIFNSFVTGNGDIQSRLDAMNNAGKNGVDPALAGSTLMLSWAVTFSGGAVTNGSDDAYITQMANEAKTYNKPLFIRLNWEMNSNSFTAYNQAGGTTPAAYIASWQHVRTIFKTVAPKAAFVWCPNHSEYNDPSGVATPNDAWYPGDQYVDWMCVDAYPEYYTPTDKVITEPYGLNWSVSFANSHNKPLMLGEYGRGSTPSSTNPVPDASTAFDVIFNWATANPVVKALCYFDLGSTHQLEAEPPTDPATGVTNPSPYPLGLQAYRSYTVSNNRYLYSIVQ